MASLPSLPTVIAYAIVLIGSAVALYLIFGKLAPWIQAYRTRQQTDALEAARKQALEENQKANSDSDALAKREHEHDHPGG